MQLSEENQPSLAAPLNRLRMNCLEIGSDKYWMDLNLINSNPIQFEMFNSSKH